MHAFQEQFDAVIRSIGLCEGCPAINQAQATIDELAAKDAVVTIPGGMSSSEYIAQTNTYLGTRFTTLEDAYSERLLREFIVEIFAIQSLKRLIEQGGPCKGAIHKDALEKIITFRDSAEEQEFRDWLTDTKEKFPHLFPKVQNVSPGGYYCEVENRRRTRLLDLFKPNED